MLCLCIRKQKGVLDQLDQQVEVAERRRQQAEKETNELENIKVKLEEIVVDLQDERDTMMQQMKDEEFQMAK